MKVTYEDFSPVYIPLLIFGFVMFVVVAYCTIMAFMKYKSILKEILSVLLYLMLNLSLIAYVLDILFISFENSNKKALVDYMTDYQRVAFAVVYHSNSTAIYCFLIRVVNSLKNNKKLKGFFNILSAICWILFGCAICTEPILRQLFGFHNNFTKMYAFYSISAFIQFVLIGIIFFVFMREAIKYKEALKLFKMKLMIAFFSCVMIGQAVYFVYFWMKIPYEFMHDYRDSRVIFCCYLNAALAHITPAILLMMLVYDN